MLGDFKGDLLNYYMSYDQLNMLLLNKPNFPYYEYNYCN